MAFGAHVPSYTSGFGRRIITARACVSASNAGRATGGRVDNRWLSHPRSRRGAATSIIIRARVVRHGDGEGMWENGHEPKRFSVWYICSAGLRRHRSSFENHSLWHHSHEHLHRGSKAPDTVSNRRHGIKWGSLSSNSRSLCKRGK
jgi:hypothetical protein